MILGFGGHNRRPSREDIEQEAATVIAKLVASGRPPPEVWRKAEEWRAANPSAGPSWFPLEAPSPSPSPSSTPPAPVVSAALVPRVVRVPDGFLAGDRQVSDDRSVVAPLPDPLGDADDGDVMRDEHVVEANEGRYDV